MSGLLIAKQFQSVDPAPVASDWLEHIHLLKEMTKQLRIDQRCFCVANGIFDLLHSGHVDMLEHAREVQDKNTFIAVLVNGDKSTLTLKGKGRPYITHNDRMKMLSALRCVDIVIGFHEATPAQLIEFLVPDYIIKGEEYRDTYVPGQEAAKHGIFWAPMSPFGHTSDLANKISATVKKNQ